MLEPEFAKLYAEMERNHIQPLWRMSSSVMPAQPQPKTIPWIWKWSDLSSLARTSGELVTLDRGGDRRALGLANPGLGGVPFATATLWAAVQWLNGGEVAPSHRHSAQAVRFMIEGGRRSEPLDEIADDQEWRVGGHAASQRTTGNLSDVRLPR